MILFRKRTFFNVERQAHRNETILIKRSTDENRWRIRAREEESLSKQNVFDMHGLYRKMQI